MAFYDRYEKLCQEKGLSSGQSEQVFEATGLKRGTVSGWKTNGNIPSGKALIQLSRFFEVSIDYLVCETDVRNRAVALTSQEETLIEVFRSVNEMDKFEIIHYLMTLRDKMTKEKTDSQDESAVG